MGVFQAEFNFNFLVSVIHSGFAKNRVKINVKELVILCSYTTSHFQNAVKNLGS